MTVLLGYLLVFLFVSVFFIFIHLMLGKVIRPSRPSAEKQTVYECGEPTIGSAWIQFDLRFYVVALLFVIFDVEVVFFFPWAVVFGKAAMIADASRPVEMRNALADELVPLEVRQLKGRKVETPEGKAVIIPDAGAQLAWLSALDIAVFFAVLLVGFAYLWRRGDLDWVRSTVAEDKPEKEVIVGASSN